MNKAVILILAICLVSVHAFVKRDAPQPAENTAGENLLKQISEVGGKFGEQLKKTFDPDTIQKNFNELYSKASNVLKQLTPTEAPTPKA